MKKETQIFYDKKQSRWQYWQKINIAVIIFFVTIFIVAAVSITIKPSLPVLDIGRPMSQFRGVPNVPKNDSASNPVNNSASPNNLFPIKDASTNLNPNTKARIITFYVNWDDNSFTSLKTNIAKIDELMPEWLHLGDGSGNIVVDDEARQQQTMEFVKQAKPNLPVSVLINNYNQDTQNWDDAALSRMLSDQNARKLTIENIQKIIEQNGFVGVNVDFEMVPDAQQKNLILFMQELYATFHPLGFEVSESVPLDDDSYNTKILSQNADFLILMAYDQNSLNDSQAGPVASQNWFASKLDLQIKNISLEKTVVAIGGYGYDWEDKKVTGQEVDFQDAIRTAQESNAKISIDQNSFNPTFDYYDEKNILHHAWFLDAITIFNEMLVGQKLGLPKGYALWRLGSEDPGTWKVFEGQQKLNEETANSLSQMDYGYDVTYEGSGEVYKVSQTPQTGKRTITYDQTSGFITDETIDIFPSSYVITRWGGESNDKKIAITFDDGPDANYTPKILDILNKYKVNATFFVIGTSANSNQNILKKIISQGSELGNHTYTHPNVTQISNEQFAVEVSATERLFESILGRKSLLFRPPYAEDIEPENPQQVSPLVQITNLGYYTIGMHIDPKDWSKPGADSIVANVLSQAKNGDGNIILLHDGGGNREQTIEALPKIIEGLQAQGFQIVTVSNLMGQTINQIMPKISAREQLVARINEWAFSSLSAFMRLLYRLSLAGILLGIARFLFIMTLAIIQWVRSRKEKFPLIKNYNPHVDIIIPAYNEEAVICKTVCAILDSSYQNFHICIVDDGSKDKTLEILLKEYAGNSRVSIFSKSNGGKADALNYGIENAAGDIIITLDADTLFHRDTIEKLVRRFSDKRIGAVAGNAKVGNRINILTRWQALEYITSQNLDRRAFEIMNCIPVVPGAVGAWRRSALLEAGGFSDSTLAEDADLTYAILKNGYQISYEDEAIGYTEAPDVIKNFIKQRFRWMYGTLQTVWKHREVFGRPKYKGLGLFAIPNVLIFQILFPFISPLMDLMLIFSIAWVWWQQRSNQIGFSSSGTLRQIVFFYVFFMVIDLVTSIIPFILEKKENWRLIFWMPFQRFFYRQLMYYVAIKSVATAVKGTFVGWGKFERKATVDEEL